MDSLGAMVFGVNSSKQRTGVGVDTTFFRDKIVSSSLLKKKSDTNKLPSNFKGYNSGLTLNLKGFDGNAEVIGHVCNQDTVVAKLKGNYTIPQLKGILSSFNPHIDIEYSNNMEDDSLSAKTDAPLWWFDNKNGYLVLKRAKKKKKQALTV